MGALMDNIQEIALQTITRVLESAAFIFTDGLDKEKPLAKTWEAQGVSLRFSGGPSGVFHMWVGKGFSCSVAANMLGIDAESGTAQSKGLDALKEILNMIVGNFITAAFGDKPLFELGIPAPADAALMEKHMNASGAVWLQAEGNPVLFVVEIDND
jgi:hypothetical protein